MVGTCLNIVLRSSELTKINLFMDKHTLTHWVLTAAEETFATMLGLQVTHQQSSADSLEKVMTSERIVALIGIAGCYNGTGTMSCSPELACKLSSQMLMADLRTVDSEVLDVISEISNMIFGNVKTMLEEQVGLLGLSIPTVVFGRNFCTRSVGEQWIDVPLRVEEHNLDLSMCLSRNHNSAEPNVVRQPVVISV